MKKIILTVFAFNFLITFSFGQINFGVKAGLNISNTKDIAPAGNTAKLGFNAGFITSININKIFIIQPELLYSVKGYKFPGTPYNSNGTASFNYISVPLLLGYCITDKLTVLAGPELNFLTNANSKFDGSNYDISKNFRKFDLAVDLGVVYKIKNGLGMEVRYSHSLKDLANVIILDPFGNEIEERKVGSHRVFQIGLFYKFKKK
jgi:Outer membrane protein beta-barrel domain